MINNNINKSEISFAGIAIGIIIYNPTNYMIENYKVFSLFHLVIFVDNSEVHAKNMLSQLDFKYEYIYNNNRGGIAGALNLAASYAFRYKYKWLLTVDQDTIISINSLQSLFRTIACFNGKSFVAIFAPFQRNMVSPKNITSNTVNDSKWIDSKEVMTSGSLVNLDVWSLVGGYKEEYFIDVVDQEFCKRCQKNGYKIIECKDYLIEHQLGDIIYKNILGFTIGVTNHSYKRYYYIFRNTLCFITQYRNDGFIFIFKKLLYLFKIIIKVIVFEKSKQRKLKWICKGVSDYFFGKREVV